ncbi:T9SS type A sorting domain-containing protein [Rhizosphaericola mali]|uniref:T9SS type A sorting domain-containing protein n=1 Tax=Rhizosphaericola mali TaxID=2545455 RepID=A0A5P2G4L7_9BACT|nr:T9SS type A sorting domain-containing protein [Rhizosphaericola mali]QES88762.1 T9SS type A sorting domain-containing protein [Rhizosphaericola mali]
MLKISYLLILLHLISVRIWSQNMDSITLAHIRQARTFYQLGQQYRTGTDVPMDYGKAVEQFEKAAALGDPHGQYALAYMSYKGLGCSQDYGKAVSLFRQGALQGYDNAMYFYGLCLRNGYGIAANKDSATYWLKYADSLGSKQAQMELAAISAENRADSAKELLENIHNAALPSTGSMNSFVRIPGHFPVGDIINGRYKGYLLQYDWSGKNLVQAKSMELELGSFASKISGQWVESGTDSFHFSASLSGDSLVFEPTTYGRTDHYSPDSALSYSLKGAAFNIVQGVDRIYLAGNVTMFSEDRGEPSKPIVLALTREVKTEQKDILLTDTKVYPNPFHDVLNISFSLGAEAMVSLSLNSISGQQVYQKAAQKLFTGTYNFSLQPPAGLAPGVYFLQVSVNGKIHSFKAVKI